MVRMTRPAMVVWALLGASAAAQVTSSIELANQPVPAGGRRIAYGADPLQFGELRLPAGDGTHPVAIVIHGGCWLAKFPNMDDRAVAFDYMRPVAAALTAAGIATWNIEYRRLGNSGGGWPGTFQDIAHAADFLRTLATDNRLDLARVIAIGHSAGGHFAMWLAGRGRLAATSDLFVADPLPLRGVVDLDGPPDLQATISVQQPICGSPVITDLVGGSPAERPGRYHDGSPIELLPLGVRQELFIGKMFAEQAAPYQAAATRAGDAVQATVLPEAGHFVFVDPKSEVWPGIVASARSLLGL